MQKQIITAVFDTRTLAEAAAKALRQLGIPATDVTMSPETAGDEFGSSYATKPEKTGFMASLENLFGGYEDQAIYAEVVRRGGVLLTAHVDDTSVGHVVSVLEGHSAVDLEKREETWRSEGWTGGATGAGMAATGIAGAGATGLAMTGTAPAATVVATETRTTAPASMAATRTAATAGAEDVLQVVEERLNVGKRAVSRGKVRLHSYMVETAVSEDVTLRDETVTVDRRTVDRPVAALGADAFKERKTEMEETDEEAVVGKTARLIEEIGIRKDVVAHTETETVRSTKVDIEGGHQISSSLTMGPRSSRRFESSGEISTVSERDQLLSIIEDWIGDKPEAKRWFENVRIPAFGNKTAEIILESGKFQTLSNYIEGLKHGGFA